MGSESLAHEANNPKENFLGQPEKMIFKFHKMTSYTVYIWNFQNFICFYKFLWNLTSKVSEVFGVC